MGFLFTVFIGFIVGTVFWNFQTFKKLYDNPPKSLNDLKQFIFKLNFSSNNTETSKPNVYVRPVDHHCNLDNTYSLDMLTCVNDSKKDDKKTFDEKLKEVEDSRNSTILIINSKKKNDMFGGLLGDSSRTCISLDDAEAIIDIFTKIDSDKTLDIILNTTGGSLTAAEMICNALINHKGQTNVFIPDYAFSAGSIIALACDKIYLEKNAVMSQVDPQMGYGMSASSILEFTDSYQNITHESFTEGTINNSDKHSWLRDFVLFARCGADKAMRRVKELVTDICKRKGYSDEELEKLIGEMVVGKYNHDKPFVFSDLQSFIKGLHDEDGIPSEMRELYKIHNKH